MKLLLIGPSPTSATDGIIVAGITNILNAAFDYPRYDYAFLKDHEEMTPLQFNSDASYDAVVICGTPWLWDSFQNSHKYNNVMTAFKAHPETPKIFLGIGTCLNLDAVGSEILKRSEEQAAMQRMFGNATVIVRDRLSRELLWEAGVNSVFMPCPAYFAFKPQNHPRKENVLIWIDPRESISGEYWKTNLLELDRYHSLIKHYYQKYQPIVYCTDKRDLAGASALGIKVNKVLKYSSETLKAVMSANIVLSGRVHCAVPAFIQERMVGLVPLDTRANVFSDMGGTIVRNQDDLDGFSLSPVDPNIYIPQYIKLLKNAIN